jgi:hypothetical protein|tara:strand:- start:22 stop:1020 length:999 start_codon:yes stop_codon:yes gene_type:complete
MTRTNIVYSSTVTWNPGDEIILCGIRNLINIDHNPIIFNRGPIDGLCKKAQSYHYTRGRDFVDHFIFAGSPEWTLESLSLYRDIEQTGTDFSFIGVGNPITEYGIEELARIFSCPPTLSDVNKHVLSKATVKITRDSLAQKSIFDSNLVCCPAFFCNPEINIKPKTQKKRIAVCWQDDSVDCCGVQDRRKTELLTEFARRNKTAVVCHAYSDYLNASKLKLDPFYSSSYQDYFDFYKEFDLVVTLRVHGAGVASSFGIPSITVQHDERAETVIHFGSELLLDAECLQASFENIDDNSLEARSSAIIKLKKEKYNQYIDILKSAGLTTLEKQS